jgi:hypothetical protein
LCRASTWMPGTRLHKAGHDPKGSDATRSETALEQFKFHRTVADCAGEPCLGPSAFTPASSATREESEGAPVTGRPGSISLVKKFGQTVPRRHGPPWACR